VIFLSVSHPQRERQVAFNRSFNLASIHNNDQFNPGASDARRVSSNRSTGLAEGQAIV